MPFFLILCLRSRDNLEPWLLMAFLLSPEEIFVSAPECRDFVLALVRRRRRRRRRPR